MLGPIPCCSCFALWAINKAVLHVVTKRANRQICKYAKLAERVLDLGVWHFVCFVHLFNTPIVYVNADGLQIIFSNQSF